MRYDAEAAFHLEPLSPDGSPTRPRSCGRPWLTKPNADSLSATTTLTGAHQPVKPAPGRGVQAWRDTSPIAEGYGRTMGFPSRDCIVLHVKMAKIAGLLRLSQDVSARR